MNNKKFIQKYLLYLVIITPSLLLFLELSLGAYYRFRNVNFPRPLGGALKYDPISGWRGYISHEPKTDKINPITFDHHGLVYNPYNTQQNKKNGIIILGDSVAQGVLSSGNKYNFSSILQKLINMNEFNFNVKNLAFSSFNSWMEHAELMRYLNTHQIHNDLPFPSIIISFGGIQDFWRLVKKFSLNDQINKTTYVNANNLMLSKENIDYALTSTAGREGNIKKGIQLMITSLKINWLKYSRIANLARETKFLLNKLNHTKSISNNSSYNYKGKSINIIYSDYYNSLVDSVTSSVERNIRSSIGASPKSKYIYVYSPTVFSSKIIKEKDQRLIVKLPGNEFLDLYTLKLIEREYRKSLLNKLLLVKDLIVLDYSKLPERDNKPWFNDYSHFNDKANRWIAEELYTDLDQNNLLE